MSGSFRTRVVETAADELKYFANQLPASGDPRPVVMLAGTARSIIIQRTGRGLDEDEKPFTPYSLKPYRAPIGRRPPGYPIPSGGRPGNLRQPYKSRTQYFQGGYGEYKRAQGFGSRVSLSVSGRMLGAIQIATSGSRRAILFFASREEAAKAHGHHFGTTVPERRFFGIGNPASVGMKSLEDTLLRYLVATAKSAQLEIERRRFP